MLKDVSIATRNESYSIITLTEIDLTVVKRTYRSFAILVINALIISWANVANDGRKVTKSNMPVLIRSSFLVGKIPTI